MRRLAAARLALSLPILLSLAVSPAVAQQLTTGFERAAPPPSRPAPGLGLERTLPPEQQGSREQEFYPGAVRTRHEPAFIKPFVVSMPVSRSSAVRVGLSGWTAPAVPFDIREATGGLAFGLTVLWGAPATEAKAPEAEPPAQR
ncbi:MAG: hypothetical protein HY002_06935 [Candidatus Rokubacteria bacterium]|nr:hypothetical protein [Candidatus Rokubacteria bacterium]